MTEPRKNEITSTAGLAAIAAAVARALRGGEWNGTAVRVASSGTQVRFFASGRHRGIPGPECFVDLVAVGPTRIVMRVEGFAGGHLDRKFAAAMESRVRAVLKGA